MKTGLTRNALTALAVAATLAACGGEPPDTDAAAAEDAAAEADDNVAQPLVDSLEKARAVDQQVQQRKSDVDAALEEAEGTADDD